MNHTTRDSLIDLLTETDADVLGELWQRADRTRHDHVGDAVHLRGLIEISNHCSRSCAYCGLRAPNSHTTRYRMTQEQILEAAGVAAELGYGTVVLQAGEDPVHTGTWVRDLVAEIKSRTSLAVTLSLGERSREDLAMWRDAGADRYLLRFETSNRELFDRIHPPRPRASGTTAGLSEQPNRERVDQATPPDVPHGECVSVRMEMLEVLRDLGYEVGSGVMVGLPGQTFADLADDLLNFARLDLDMVGLGPFISHPDTPLAQQMDTVGVGPDDAADDATNDATTVSPARPESTTAQDAAAEAAADSAGVSPGDRSDQPGPLRASDQPAADVLTTCKMIALTRLLLPDANIPSTSALATIDTEQGRELALQRGANIIMPNVTPTHYRTQYQIYPGKACIHEEASTCHSCLAIRIHALGRTIGTGRGDSPGYAKRRTSRSDSPGQARQAHAPRCASA